MTRRELLLIFCIFVLWRGTLFVIGANASALLPYQPSFPHAEAVLAKFKQPLWFYSWANFDGVHYLTIAEHGYKGFGLVQAFFPVYPMLIKLVSYDEHQLLVGGLLISNLSFLAVLFVFFSLVKKTFSSEVAWRSLILFLVFPTSFFAVALYNESLFLLFVLLSFYAVHYKKWFWAGILGGFASATRVVGIFVMTSLMLGLLATNLEKNNFSKNEKATLLSSIPNSFRFIFEQRKAFIFLSLGTFGLLGYMTYLWFVFGDPLYFLHLQSEFGSGREEHLVLLPQTLWRAVKIIFTVPFDLRFITYFQEIILTGLVLVILCFGFKKKFAMPYAWLFYAVLVILLPTTTGTLTSMPRYVLVAFPFFVILAQMQLPKYVWYSLYFVSAALLFWNTIVFIQGYWIA